MNERQTLRHFDRLLPGMLESLYEAVDQPDAWQGFMERLVDASHGRSARLLFLNDRADQVGASHKVNIDDNAHQAYVQHFVNTCPWRPELAHKRPGRLYSTYLDFSCRQAQYYQTEFFNDWARGLDIHHGICGSVFKEKGLTVQLLVQRTGEQGHFTEQETEAVNRLIPHIQRSLHLSRQLETMRRMVSAVGEVADNQGLPFLLLGENGGVNFMSLEAQVIIQDSDALQLRRNRLQLAGLPADRSFRRHVQQKLLGQAQGGARPSILRVGRPGLPDLQLILTPLHPDMPALQLTPVTSHLAVFIHDPLRTPELDLERLMEMYGLTTAEARMAGRLVKGQDIAQIAQDTGTSVHTLRTQLKSCFRKTGTCRQSELTCLLLTGPSRYSMSGRQERDEAELPGRVSA